MALLVGELFEDEHCVWEGGGLVRAILPEFWFFRLAGGIYFPFGSLWGRTTAAYILSSSPFSSSSLALRLGWLSISVAI